MVLNDHISEGGGRGIKGEAVIPPRDHRANPPLERGLGRPWRQTVRVGVGFSVHEPT